MNSILSRVLLVAIVLIPVFAAAPAAAIPWADDRLLLLVLRSRGVLCQPDEACTAGTCSSDGVTSCSLTTDCPNCLSVQNRDVVMCHPQSLGRDNTVCRWSLFFDATAAGLNAPIQALEVLSDGSLLMRTSADNAIPDISGANRRDLVRFIPTDENGRRRVGDLPYTRGEWRVFLDGRRVDATSGARLMDGISVLANSCRDVNADGEIEQQECDVLFSPVSGGVLAGIEIEIEDIIRCRPAALSAGGTIEACEYAMFYDASEVNDSTPHDGLSERMPGSWVNGGSGAFAVVDFDPEEWRAGVLFTAGNDNKLPTHQPTRDLLLNVGLVGPRGWCSDDAVQMCLSPSDCSASDACDHQSNPETNGETTLLFDGSTAIGVETLAAIAVVDDRDGDGFPDPIDNCPDVPNPAVCSGSGAVCVSTRDCSAGESCRQPDSDDDGIGDACDSCHGCEEARGSCGDFAINAVGEQCDLGARAAGGFNGVADSPCSADCRLRGRCTRSGGDCSVAADCPAAGDGEGCCGNGIVDGFPAGSADEACDDANVVDDDTCDNSCRLVANPLPLPQECEGLVGPQIVPTFVRALRFQKQLRQVSADADPDRYSKWTTRGEFSLIQGLPFDPDSQRAELIFNQGAATCDGGERAGEACVVAADCPAGRCGATLYRAILPSGSFVQAGLRNDRARWSFRDRNGRQPGAPGWTKGRFAQRLATIRRPLNQVRFNLHGRGDRLEPQLSLHLDPTAMGGPPTRVRQTIVVGDLCTTQALTCEPNLTGKTLQCFSRFD